MKLPKINEVLTNIKEYNRIPDKLFDIMIDNLKKVKWDEINEKIYKSSRKN
jgi:hypothetical protein